MADSLTDQIADARRVLLDRIIKEGADAHAPYLREMCEAYAWVSAPAQSHGGELSVKVQK